MELLFTTFGKCNSQGIVFDVCELLIETLKIFTLYKETILFHITFAKLWMKELHSFGGIAYFRKYLHLENLIKTKCLTGMFGVLSLKKFVLANMIMTIFKYVMK